MSRDHYVDGARELIPDELLVPWVIPDHPWVGKKFSVQEEPLMDHYPVPRPWGVGEVVKVDTCFAGRNKERTSRFHMKRDKDEFESWFYESDLTPA